MDPIRISTWMRVQHKHNDGSWGVFEPHPEHHDVSSHDPERDWSKGRLYRCTTCDEEILVELPDAEGAGHP